jgi:hypothetical protein
MGKFKFGKKRFLDIMKAHELKGKQFGELAVLERDCSRKGCAYWACRCSCGATSVVSASNLVNGKTKTCNNRRLHLAENLVGMKFGELTVLRRDWNRTDRAFWICCCDCGGTKSVAAKHLKGGNVDSCRAICHRIGNKNPCWKGYEEVSGKYWSRMVKGAIERNLEVSITIEDVWELFLIQNRKCSLTGEQLTLINNNGINQGFGTASLDRIDSAKGYTVNNIQWLHKDINALKSNLPQDKFIELCNKVVKHNCKNSLGEHYESFTFI